MTQYQDFSDYEIEIAEKVLKGYTVVAAMRNFNNPFSTPFLRWVKSNNLDQKIDRSTIWGNPYNDKYQTVDQRISQYEKYLTGNQKLMEKLPELRGKVLLCWCKKLNKHLKGSEKDQPCHGDILAKLCNPVNSL